MNKPDDSSNGRNPIVELVLAGILLALLIVTTL